MIRPPITRNGSRLSLLPYSAAASQVSAQVSAFRALRRLLSFLGLVFHQIGLRSFTFLSLSRVPCPLANPALLLFLLLSLPLLFLVPLSPSQPESLALRLRLSLLLLLDRLHPLHPRPRPFLSPSSPAQVSPGPWAQGRECP